MEASGTSGQKAGVNGVVNLSVLDGWWGEGYNGDNGWAITPHGPKYDVGFRDREEAQTLLDILEHQVVPLYYSRDDKGYSEGWVEKSKASMKSILPQFNAQRMVMDYVRNSYGPASRQAAKLATGKGEPAKSLAAWKQKVDKVWNGVSMHRLDKAVDSIKAGETWMLRIAADLNGLSPQDVRVECLVGTGEVSGELRVDATYIFNPVGPDEEGKEIFEIDMVPRLSGLQFYQIRMYPYHELLTHPFETGYMVWI